MSRLMNGAAKRDTHSLTGLQAANTTGELAPTKPILQINLSSFPLYLDIIRAYEIQEKKQKPNSPTLPCQNRRSNENFIALSQILTKKLDATFVASKTQWNLNRRYSYE